MIYTIGSIAVSGNTLTGTGTNFKAPLSMIRVGCTVIVKSDPIQIFSITEIVSETELSVTPAAAPDIPAGTAYSILLCDSISVDGLAQDVAEALRYFTGQESEIYAAVEYWKNYGDTAQVEALLTAIQAETAQSTANAAATAADAETTATARDEAVAAKDAAESYSVLAGEHAATATTQATTATEQATTATNAASAAQTAQTATEAARDEAVTQATTATEQATIATEAATAASADADTVAADRIAVYELRMYAKEEAEKAETAATAAETSAANVAADEQEIAANAAAAAESATAAALSEANAKTYVEQAKSLSQDSLSLIGLGADRRDWPDCTVDPSAYIGFVRLEEATATGFPSIASGEVYLVGWLARGDGAIINGCFVGTNTRSLYTYHFNNADGTYGWTRHARKDEVSRFNQSGSDRTVVYSMDDPTTGCYLQLDATGRWGYYSPVDNCWKALAIEQGGTGATTLDDARLKLQVDRLLQHETSGETNLTSGDSNIRLFVKDNGQWGAWNSSKQANVPLAVANGGTGATDAATARTNLAAMHEQKSTLGDTDLDTLTAAYSGFYWQSASSKATTELHYPCNYGGALVVLKNNNYTNGATQLYYPYNSTGLYYMRTYYANHETWTEWAKFESDPLIHEEAPFPDVWIPFNDSLDMLAGFAPGYKKVTVNGETTSIPSDKVVTFARASTATYINKSGVLTIADIDEPRFEREGLLIEGTRTNHLPNSNTPTSWNIDTGALELTESGTDSYGFNYGTLTCTADAVITATLISTGTARVIATASGELVTISGRFKGTGVRARACISKLNEGGSGNTFIADALLDLDTQVLTCGADSMSSYFVDEGNGWLFFSTTYTATEDMDVYARFELAPKDGETLAVGDSITMTTPQYEAGSCASSFIVSGSDPTTRASDMVSIPATNNLFNPPLSFLVEVHKEWSVGPNTYPRIWDGIDASSGRSMIAAISSNNGKLYFGISKAIASSSINSYTSAALDEISTFGAVVRADNTGHTIMNGEIGAEVTYEYLEIIAGSTIRIGGGSTTGDRHLFGHIRNFRIWHKALTDGQLFEKV